MYQNTYFKLIKHNQMNTYMIEIHNMQLLGLIFGFEKVAFLYLLCTRITIVKGGGRHVYQEVEID